MSIIEIPGPMRSWFKREFENNYAAAAAYLWLGKATWPQDSLFWDALEATGDTAYDQETFLKAAQIIMGAQ